MDANAVIVGIGGVALGATLTALLTRRYQRQSRRDALLAEAANDAIDRIAGVAAGIAPDAQARYASAVSRVALHGSPQVIATWRPHGPATVAKAINRSSGAVANCLKRLAASNQVRQISDKPLRYDKLAA